MTSLHSNYSKLTGDREDRRLRLQNEAVRFFDGDVYRRVLGQYDAPLILDVGCGRGDMISQMTDGSAACAVFGIDSARRQIELAAAGYPGGKFSVMDIEQDSFSEDMRGWMEAEGVNGFDVINCSMILMHLSDPVKALTGLRSLLSEGGTLIVRELDDGLNTAFPDPGERFRKLFELFAGDDRLGDRHCGRKVSSYLKKAGFRVVRLEKEGLANISMPDRKLLYEMSIPFFLDNLKSRSEKEPGNDQYREAYEWCADNIDEMRESFSREDFFFSLGFMSFTAS